MGNAQSEEERLFFFQQDSEQPLTKKRYRKLPEDLPEGLKFAHLHPKVAALYAQKERENQRAAEKDPFGDGLGNKSLLPNINQAVTHIKNRLDSALSNDEDSQRFLFEDTKTTAASVLQQLAKYLYFYDGIASHVPKSLEYQLMSNWKDLTNDVIIVPREWQTTEIRDQYYNSLREAQSDDDSDNETKVGKSSEKLESKSKSKKLNKPTIPDIIEDEFRPDKPANRRSESRMSTVSISRGKLDVKGLASKGSREHRGSSALTVAGIRSPAMRKQTHDDLISNFGETPSDPRSTAMANPSFGQQVVINFAISSKLCQDKGWIIEKGKPEVEPQKVYENCIQILQEFLKKIETEQKDDSDRGHDKEVLVRYYGDYKKEVLLKYRKTPAKPQINSLFKTGKPKIPPLHEERNQGKKLLQATHQDGTSVVYYPSGRSAIVYCSAGAELGRPGYYLIAYDDTNDHRMLACFTPAGRGVCYSTNGNIRFLSTEKGGHLAEADGTIVRKWKWPVNNVKLTSPANVQLNSNLVFRCNGQNSMSLMFSCQKELARFSASPAPGATEYRPSDENEHLLMTFTYTSKAARDLMRLFAPKHKQRSKKQGARKQKGHLAEIQKLLVDFPDKTQYELEADKELARLQRKARNLVDDWLEHYRLAVGLKSPHMLNVRESPDFSSQARNIQSAKLADGGQAARLKHLGLETLVDYKKQRAPSAPLVKDRSDLSKSLDADTSKSKRGQKSGTQSAVKFDDGPQEGEGEEEAASPTALAMLDRLSQSAGKRSARSNTSAVSSAPLSRQHTATFRSENSNNQFNRIPCPIALRQRILGLDQPSCRCSRHYIPQIMDIEYDEFIQMEAPDTQIIVIAVISSLFPHTSSSDQMIEEIYLSQNRNRTKPCVQSRTDMFRILQYDINSASEGSDHTQPLLLTRHNVVPGMFLIYLAGKLLFCDHIFNGYGNARKDFKKQLMKSRVEALQGFSLPKDFRFSPSRGRSGMRSGWGGEIGGTGVDHYGNPGTAYDTSLVPLSRSMSSLSDEKKEAPIDTVKRVDTNIVSRISIPGEFRELDPRRNLSAPGRRLVQGSVT